MGVEACADLLRINVRTIHNWETDKTRIPYAAYKLLRVIKCGRYMAHPNWHHLVVQGAAL